jgi:hypothetical protein
VVTVAGPYRTGKSFLCNRLLNQNSGFTLGKTINACTKGIWVWNELVQFENKSFKVLVMDTEGLGSTERSTDIDTRIFALSILLSSTFIFNQMGPIDESKIEDIGVVTKLSKLIRTKMDDGAEDFDDDFSTYFPNLVWVCRDFHHELEEGMDAKGYLEAQLQPVLGKFDQDSIQRNKIREALLKYFKERDCHLMVRPVSDEQKLQVVD